MSQNDTPQDHPAWSVRWLHSRLGLGSLHVVLFTQMSLYVRMLWNHWTGPLPRYKEERFIMNMKLPCSYLSGGLLGECKASMSTSWEQREVDGGAGVDLHVLKRTRSCQRGGGGCRLEQPGCLEAEEPSGFDMHHRCMPIENQVPHDRGKGR